MPDTGFDRHDGTSSEEESDGEIVITNRRKSFGIRVAQTPQQAAQQVLSQIGNMANQRQANEVVVQQTESHEKTDAEKKALEQHQKMLEAQQLAKAQQAAALQAAAARVAQAQGQAQNHQAAAQEQARAQQEAALRAAQEQAKKAQQEALARAQKAQEEAIARAKAAQEAQQKAQQEALQRAQEAQKKAQEEAKARAQQALEAAKQQAQKTVTQTTTTTTTQNSTQNQQKPAQPQAQVQRPAQPAQPAAQRPAPQAQVQKPAQNGNLAQNQQKPVQNVQQVQKPAPVAQNAPKAAPVAPKPAPVTQNAPKAAPVTQNTSRPAPVAQKPVQNTPTIPQKSELTGTAQKGALSQAQPAQQEVQAAAGPKWSRTPGKNQIQGPQPDQPKQVTAVAPPHGKTALRQTVQVQEQELANDKGHVMSPVVARKPQIQADQLAQKFVEKPEEQMEKLAVQKGQQLEGAKRWVAESEVREQPNGQMIAIERGPKATILQDDACWQTQRRIPAEIQQPQVGKIAIPELNEKEVQRTIVAQPASYHKVQWNEFPEEFKPELAAAPKTKTQDWVPVNNEQNELQRSIYKPARMSAIWPPPQDELVKEGQAPLVVKANDDTAWIQQDQNGVLKQAVWGKTSRINRVWPPPENETSLSDFGPQHMPVVQWPPPESEAHEREQVEVLQKHIPTKKMERQWPPPPPQYQVIESTGEIETRYNPAEVEHQQAGQQVIRTVIRSQ